MCTICGCESAQSHAHEHGHVHDDVHDHPHPQAHGGDMHTRVLQLEQDILAGNDHVAAHIREHLAAHHTLALNLVSSPGSGKTTLLVETVQRLQADRKSTRLNSSHIQKSRMPSSA